MGNVPYLEGFQTVPGPVLNMKKKKLKYQLFERDWDSDIFMG